MFALVVLCLLTLSALSLAGLVNVTVDDAGVDPLTGQMISYSATVTTFTGWKAQPGCGANCSLAPDAKYAYNGTWHDGSVGAYAQFSFTGLAVYVWCIIPQGIANISFGIDNNSYVGTYMTTTPETGFAYRALVFSKIMPEGPHILTLNSNVNGVVLLDCITYTYDNTSETDFSDPVQFGPFNSSNQTISSSSLTRGDVAGIVIGSVFAGGIMGACLYALCLYLITRLRNANNQPQEDGDQAKQSFRFNYTGRRPTRGSSYDQASVN